MDIIDALQIWIGDYICWLYCRTWSTIYRMILMSANCNMVIILNTIYSNDTFALDPTITGNLMYNQWIGYML